MTLHNEAAFPTAGTAGGGDVMDEYITEEQLAEKWKKTLRTLRNWRARGEMPPYSRIGDPRRGQVVYAKADVREHFAKRRVNAEAKKKK